MLLHFSLTVPDQARERLATRLSSFSSASGAGYDTPFGQTGATPAVKPSPKHEERAFLAHSGKDVTSSMKYELPAFSAKSENTFDLKFADGGNTEIQVSVRDDAPEDIPTYIEVHGMTEDLDAHYLHEILSTLVWVNRARGVVFNLPVCGRSTATSPTFHHGVSNSDLGAIITWVTMKCPKSKVYIIGTSLGGVITAKSLGQWGGDCPVSAAALISPVCDFGASCKAMETNLVSRTVFNPTVGAFYANLLHLFFRMLSASNTGRTRFPKRLLRFASVIDAHNFNSSQPFHSAKLSTSDTAPGSTSFWMLPTSAHPTSPTPSVAEHTPEIKDALAKSPKATTSFAKASSRRRPMFTSGEEFMAATSAVNDLPEIRVPCLVVNCADDPLRAGEALPRSGAKRSPFVVMAILKKGGHLRTFTTKKWRKQHWKKRYHTAVVEEWFKANNEALPI
ncbi:hypothetical protein FRC01_002654 [Tulasnella sp. 417]|nr:hypothetical protein FRC01_002654 [Tulasnella sp. 417]